MTGACFRIGAVPLLLLLLAIMGGPARGQQQPAGWDWAAEGRLALHAIRYGRNNSKHSGLETEALALALSGGNGQGLRARLVPDLDGEDTPRNLSEAWLEWDRPGGGLLRVGQFLVGLGTESATPAQDLPLVGHAFGSYLDGRTDLGLRLEAPAAGRLWWQASATAGHGFGLQGRLRSSPQLALRAVWQPPGEAEASREGLYAGLGLAWSPHYDDPIELATPIEQTVFTTPDLDGKQALWVHPELLWRARRFRLGWEGTLGQVSDVPVGAGQTEDMDQLTAWSAWFTWTLRGEAARWHRGRWQPTLPEGSLPLELSFRYSNADIDRRLFDFGIASYNPSTQEVRTLSTALSGYLDPRTRLALQWVFVIADDELATFGGTNRADSLVLRLDKRF